MWQFPTRDYVFVIDKLKKENKEGEITIYKKKSRLMNVSDNPLIS